MNLAHCLARRGMPQQVIDDLLRCLPRPTRKHFFYDAASIMKLDRGFDWPGRTRFVMVGDCPNGDLVAIDTRKEPGAVFYVSHDLVAEDRPLEEVVIRVADSPSDFIQKLLDEDDLPCDFWEAKSRNREPDAAPNGGPG